MRPVSAQNEAASIVETLQHFFKMAIPVGASHCIQMGENLFLIVFVSYLNCLVIDSDHLKFIVIISDSW